MALVDLNEVHRSAIKDQRFQQVVPVEKGYVDHLVDQRYFLTYSEQIYVQLQLGER